jgi:hypothetical protein
MRGGEKKGKLQNFPLTILRKEVEHYSVPYFGT